MLFRSKLPELIGHDAEFIATGHVRIVYDEAQFAVIDQYAKDAKHWGLDLEILGRAELKKRFAFFGTEPCGGSYAPHDGHANPRLAAPAFGRAAKRDGAQVIENCEVLAVEKDAQDFRVTTATGLTVAAPAALICSGAWGGAMSLRFGEAVPITPKGPTMGVTEPMPYGIVPVIGVSTMIEHEGVYFRQVKRGNIVFGGGRRNPAYLDHRRANVNPNWTLAQLYELRRVVPALGRLNVLRTWSGVEGYMSDDIPIMGPSAKVSGLYYAFGFCGHGFQLGPGVGDVMAELIATGATTTPIEPFHIRRFALAPTATMPLAVNA